jgi:hypothetical protein
MARLGRCQGLCRAELVKIVPPGLEADSRQQLERARPARAKRLDDARVAWPNVGVPSRKLYPANCRLAMLKALNASPATVSLALFVCELLAQTEVGVEERVTEPIVRRPP